MLLIARQGAVDVKSALFGAEPDGAVVVGLTLGIELSLQAEGSLGGKGIHACGVLGNGNSEQRVAPQCIGAAEGRLRLKQIAARIVGPAHGHGVEQRVGGLIALELVKAQRCIKPHIAVPVAALGNQRGVVSRGCLIVVSADIADGAQAIDLTDIWVAAYRLRAVADGAVIVAKIILGNGAEIIRLIQVGLGGYGLIEILDGEDIVLVIESILPYADYALHIGLRPHA